MDRTRLLKVGDIVKVRDDLNYNTYCVIKDYGFRKNRNYTIVDITRCDYSQTDATCIRNGCPGNYQVPKAYRSSGSTGYWLSIGRTI